MGQVAGFIFAAAFFWTLLVLSIYDIRHQILPDSLVATSIGVAALSVLFHRLNLWGLPEVQPMYLYVVAGAVLFLFFGGLWFLSRGRWMGFGDAKLAFAVGLFLGWPLSVVALFSSFWIGAVVGVGWVLWRRVRTLQVPIPFGPFLAAGALVAYLWGAPLIEWYFSILRW